MAANVCAILNTQLLLTHNMNIYLWCDSLVIGLHCAEVRAIVMLSCVQDVQGTAELTRDA